MVGASLLGISQWLAAKERPPHLVVVVPDDSPNDTYRYLWYLGGMEPGPGRRARAEVPGVESEYGIAVSHPWFDDFWRQRAMLREDLEALARDGLPALTSDRLGQLHDRSGVARLHLDARGGRRAAGPGWSSGRGGTPACSTPATA